MSDFLYLSKDKSVYSCENQSFWVRSGILKNYQKNFEPFESFPGFLGVENKERILIAAEKLFFQYGIRSVTMDEVAHQTGMSKKTIYQWFSDKNTLVREVARYRLETERELVRQVQKMTQHPIEEMIVSMKVLRDLSQKVNPVVFYDLQKYHVEAWNLYKAHKDFFRSIVEENLVRGVEMGLYRAEVNPAILSIFRIECVEMGFDQSLFPMNRFQFEEVQIQFIDHFLYGILTEKGRSLYQEILSKMDHFSFPNLVQNQFNYQ